MLNSRELQLSSKKSVSEQEVSDFMVLRAFISEYESEQKYDTTKGENYFRSRTSQELEFINNLNFEEIEKVYFELLDLFYLLNMDKIIPEHLSRHLYRQLECLAASIQILKFVV